METLIVFTAKYLLYITGLLWLACFARLSRPEQRQLLVAAAVGAVVALVLIQVFGALWYDARPFVVSGTTPLFPHGPDNGFPSDHVTVVAFAAGLLWSHRRRWSLVILASGLLIGWARVEAQVHHWPDIGGGFLAGIMAAALGTWLAPRVIRLAQRRDT